MTTSSVANEIIKSPHGNVNNPDSGSAFYVSHVMIVRRRLKGSDNSYVGLKLFDNIKVP